MVEGATFPVPEGDSPLAAMSDGSTEVFLQPWVELHNPNSFVVSLNGFSLSDDPGRPERYRFPPGIRIRPGEYLIVFLYDPEDCQSQCAAESAACRLDCESAALGCEEDCVAAPDELACREQCVTTRDACLEGCDVAEAGCLDRCAPRGLVTDFRINNEDEPVLLFAEAGQQLVDRLEVRGQRPGTSYGIDPDTGEYGVLYLPTPMGPNQPINLRIHQFSELPRAGSSSECVVPVPVQWTIERDEAAPGELEVFFEQAVIADCSELPGEEDIVRTLVTPAETTSVDSTRVDPAGQPVSVPVMQMSYVAGLEGGACGTFRRFRVVARDSLGEVASAWQCYEYGAAPITVVVNEYLPLNTALVFERRNAAGQITDDRATPDWIEITNHGDAPIDIGPLGLISGNDLAGGRFDRWLFGVQGLGEGTGAPAEVLLGPGEYLLFLADDDEGAARRTYFLQGDASRTPYYSTSFALDPTFRPGNQPDEFNLVDPRTRTVLDRVILDFTGIEGGILQDQSAGRQQVEGTAPNALQPGTVSDCPTPLAPNTTECDLGPVFAERVTRETVGCDAPDEPDAPVCLDCPLADRPAVVRAQVSVDRDTPESEIQVTFTYTVDGGPEQVITGPPDLMVASADDQTGAQPGSILYDITVTVPAQPEGSLVVFEFLARDNVLGLETRHAEDLEPRPEASFRYLAGYTPPADRPRINEVLPGNTSIRLPAFDCVTGDDYSTPDFAEIRNPSDSELDLGGYYLTDESSPDAPVGLARQWEFPAGTMVPPGGLLLVYFGPPPDLPSCPQDPPGYIEVTGFNLADCEETLHLVAPDDPARGANCVVDSLSWALSTNPSETPSCDPDVAFGLTCDYRDSSTRLPEPTPGDPNPLQEDQLPTLFHDAYLASLSPGSENDCLAPDSPFQILRARFFLDERLRSFGDRGAISGVFFVDFGLGGGEQVFPVGTIIEDTEATPPEGYLARRIQINLTPPPPDGIFGPVVQYRVELTDACGGTVESGPLSLGTTEAEHPAVFLNELNRSYPPSSGASPGPWLEVYNASAGEVDLSGMYITDDPFHPRKGRIPDGSVVGPQGHLVIPTGGEAAGPGAIDLDWVADSGTLYLLDATGRGTCNLDKFAFDFTAPGTQPDDSIGRDPDGSATIRVLDVPSPGQSNSLLKTFIRGDANEDLRVNVSDMIRILGILFQGDTRLPACLDSIDVNDDGQRNATDPIYLGNSLFRGGPPLPEPFPEPGPDPTPDDIPECSLEP